MSFSQITEHKGKRILQFINDIDSGKNKWHKIILGELSPSATTKIASSLGLVLAKPLQIFIKDTVLHARNRKHTLTNSDWMQYPELLELFDDVGYGKPALNPDLLRVVLKRKLSANRWQGGVADLALKGKEPRILSVTYFIGNDKEIEAWWQQNKKP